MRMEMSILVRMVFPNLLLDLLVCFQMICHQVKSMLLKVYITRLAKWIQDYCKPIPTFALIALNPGTEGSASARNVD